MQPDTSICLDAWHLLVHKRFTFYIFSLHGYWRLWMTDSITEGSSFALIWLFTILLQNRSRAMHCLKHCTLQWPSGPHHWKRLFHRPDTRRPSHWSVQSCLLTSFSQTSKKSCPQISFWAAHALKCPFRANAVYCKCTSIRWVRSWVPPYSPEMTVAVCSSVG